MKTATVTLHEHIRELRRRLAWSVLVFLVGGIAGYSYRKELIATLRRPLHQTLYYTSPAGGFNFVMKIAMATGIALALPVIVYNAIEFVRPALPGRVTRAHAHRAAIFSLFLAALGAAFAFYMVVPISLKFFLGFSASGIQSLLSAQDYLDFVTNHIMTFMVIFQLPVILLFIDRFKPLSPQTLIKYDKHVIIGSAALSILLPFTYDPVSQFLVGMPIVFLYNFTIVLLFIRHYRPRRRRKAPEPVHPVAELESTPEPESEPESMPQPAPLLQALQPLLTPQLVPVTDSEPEPKPIAVRSSPSYQSRLIMDIQPRRMNEATEA